MFRSDKSFFWEMLNNKWFTTEYQTQFFLHIKSFDFFLKISSKVTKKCSQSVVVALHTLTPRIFGHFRDRSVWAKMCIRMGICNQSINTRFSANISHQQGQIIDWNFVAADGHQKAYIYINSVINNLMWKAGPLLSFPFIHAWPSVFIHYKWHVSQLHWWVWAVQKEKKS